MNFKYAEINRRHYRNNLAAKYLLLIFIVLACTGLVFPIYESVMELSFLTIILIIVICSFWVYAIRKLEGELELMLSMSIEIEDQGIIFVSPGGSEIIPYSDIMRFQVQRVNGMKSIVLKLEKNKLVALPPVEKMGVFAEELKQRMPGKYYSRVFGF